VLTVIFVTIKHRTDSVQKAILLVVITHKFSLQLSVNNRDGLT